MLLPLQGAFTDCHYTQGDALGYALVGLSARFACWALLFRFAPVTVGSARSWN